MAAESEMVYRWVEWLKCGTDDQQYQAALALRNLAGDACSKHLIREAGGIESLLRLLDAGSDSMLTVVGAETLSCLAADDSENRVRGRGSDRRESCTLGSPFQPGPLLASILSFFVYALLLLLCTCSPGCLHPCGGQHEFAAYCLDAWQPCPCPCPGV